GRPCLLSWRRFIPKVVGAGGHPLDWSACCGCISRSSALGSPMRAWKMRSTTATPFAALSALILAARRRHATTLLKFRRLLERHHLTRTIFATINDHLAAQGLLLREGTIVDASLIAAPPSTKNKAKARDPEMHQTRKGKQYYFGMKAHIGVDAHSGLVHSVKATAANVSDVTQAHALLHG